MYDLLNCGVLRPDESANRNQASPSPQAPGGSAQRFSAPVAKLQQAPAESADVKQIPAQTGKVQAPVSATTSPPPPPTGAGVGGGIGSGSAGKIVGGTVGGQPTRQQSGAASAAPPQARSNNGTVQVDEQARIIAKERDMHASRSAPQAMERVEVTGAAAAVGGPETIARAPLAKVMAAGAIPRWRVSAQGAVERSIDGGHTWLSMPMAAKPGTFRSVSVVDHDVWAGGAGGALYHSNDEGRTWTRVTVQAFDMVLATDIARVEFTDAQRGSVTTTTGVTWTTSDAGATWSVRAKPPM